MRCLIFGFKVGESFMSNIHKYLSSWTASAFLALAPCAAFGEIIYSENTTLNASPQWSENVTVNAGASLVFGANVLPGQTSDITVNLLGSLTFNSNMTDNHAAANSLVNANDRAIMFTGTGTLIKTGSGAIAAQSANFKSSAAGYSVKFAFSDGALIDIQAGTLRNGGYATQNWSENKADLRIASGAQLDIWDGANTQFDSLIGAGNITTGQTSAKTVTLGAANSTWLENDIQTTPEFSGNFNSGKPISLKKIGSGTQILSGNYLSTGTITVSDGTLQIGNGETGSIGTNAKVTVEKNAILNFNSETGTEIAQTLSGEGTVNLLKGTLLIKDNSSFNGTINTAAGTVLGLGVKTSSLPAYAAGTNLMLNVNENDSNAFTAADFNSFRTQGVDENFIVGVYTPLGITASQSISGEFLSVNAPLQKVGGGTFAMTGTNSEFNAELIVKEGAVSLGNGTAAGSISADAAVSVEAGSQFIFNNGAESSTVVTNSISGSGELVIASGTVRYAQESPILYSETNDTYGAGASRIDLPQVTIKNGAKLVFEDGVTPTFNKKSGTFTIETGGTLELINSTRGENHYWNNSANFMNGTLTINGGGTLLKTGNKAVALLCQSGYGGTVAMAMDEGGWIDIQEGQLLNGGWSVSINWANNKSSLNVASGAKFNMWDGLTNSNVYVDSLTGSGTLERGHIHLGAANNADSEKYGVAENTAIFSGIIQGSAAAVTKAGTGTQILTGNNNYSGNTTVTNGTLQIGNGGDSGKIGTGIARADGDGILLFKTSQENAVAEIQGSGTIRSENSGKVTAAAFNGFHGTLNPVSKTDLIELNVAENQAAALSAKITGNGTVSLAMKDGASVDMRMGRLDESASLVISGGSLTIDGDNFKGTLEVAGNSTLNLASTVSRSANPWAMTYYKPQRLTPGGTPTESIEHGDVYDMWQGANAATHAEVNKVMPANYSTLSYRTFIEVTEDLSLDFSGQFDDSQGVWVIACDQNGTPLAGETWRTLLGYAGNCATNTAAGVELAAGYYLMDVRVTDEGGNRYAQSGVKDSNGKNLGIGMRLNGAETYSAMNIDQESGSLNGSDGKIIAGKAEVAGEQRWNDAKLNIAENSTLSLDNPNVNVNAVTLDNAKITGKGLLALTASGNENTKFTLSNLTAEGSVSLGDSVTAELSGAINGDLLLGSDTALDFQIDTSNTEPVLTLGGEADLTDVFMNIAVTGNAPENGDILSLILIAAEDDSITGFEPGNISWDIEDTDLRLSAGIMNGNLTLAIGNSHSLPEPASCVMLLLGVGIFSGIALAKKRKMC